MRKPFILFTFCFSSALFGGPLDLSYGFNGTLIENFDSMGVGSSAPGTVGVNSPWSVVTDTELFDNLGVASAPGDFGGAYGAFNTGIDGDGDRALGIYRDKSNDAGHLIARFTNISGASISNLHLLFDVELLYQDENTGTRWGGVQAFISSDNISYVDLGDLFQGTVVTSATNTSGIWLSDDVPGNATRGIGGAINVAAALGGAISQGSDFYIKFDMATNVAAPDGFGLGNNKQIGTFVDNLQLTSLGDDAIPEPSTYLLLVTMLIIVALVKSKREKVAKVRVLPPRDKR